MIYHKDIGFPSFYHRPIGIAPVTYSPHALAQSAERGIVIPGSVNLTKAQIIEVGFNNRRQINHLLVRIPHDSRNDLVMAISVGRKLFVKTVWLNAKTDNHRGLDRSKYLTP